MLLGIIGNGLIRVGAGAVALTIARIEWLDSGGVVYFRFHLSDGSIAGGSSNPVINFKEDANPFGYTTSPNDFSGDVWAYIGGPDGFFDPAFGISVVSGLAGVGADTPTYVAADGVMDASPNPDLEF